MPQKINFYRLANKKQYTETLVYHSNELQQLEQLENNISYELNDSQNLFINGFSWPAQSNSRFLIDKLYQDKGQINFRERLICEKTGFNNRVRGAIHIFEQLFKPQKTDAIYVTEQMSLLYQWLIKKYSNTVGSEYIAASIWRNKIRFKLKLFPRKLNHQDLTALTYQKERFNHVLSFDCFEHIPDYKQALKEILRVLKPQGKLLFSVPFNNRADETLVRASINKKNETVFHVEPEYHGNPMSKEGSLSYYTFGWDLLETLQEIGFKQAYAVAYWSKEYVYLGGPQLLFCAEK